MAAKRTKRRSVPQESGEPHRRTPTFLLEMPLVVNEGQAKRLRGHLEAGRQLSNAVLGEGQRRLRQM
ncbi:MAG TPA: AAA family ATPase, partial [Ktedonobacteraceae bacterium]|nr:AAA family ATPase [Ktedonobacteraceae bacterium]